VAYSPMVPFDKVCFMETLDPQGLVYFGAEVVGVSLSVWFYYEAVAKGGRLDVPSKRQAVILIQFHREDGPL